MPALRCDTCGAAYYSAASTPTPGRSWECDTPGCGGELVPEPQPDPGPIPTTEES